MECKKIVLPLPEKLCEDLNLQGTEYVLITTTSRNSFSVEVLCNCPYCIPDQNGEAVCMRNEDCPGECPGFENCPYKQPREREKD